MDLVVPSTRSPIFATWRDNLLNSPSIANTLRRQFTRLQDKNIKFYDV